MNFRCLKYIRLTFDRSQGFKSIEIYPNTFWFMLTLKHAKSKYISQFNERDNYPKTKYQSGNVKNKDNIISDKGTKCKH